MARLLRETSAHLRPALHALHAEDAPDEEDEDDEDDEDDEEEELLEEWWRRRWSRHEGEVRRHRWQGVAGERRWGVLPASQLRGKCWTDSPPWRGREVEEKVPVKCQDGAEHLLKHPPS